MGIGRKIATAAFRFRQIICFYPIVLRTLNRIVGFTVVRPLVHGFLSLRIRYARRNDLSLAGIAGGRYAYRRMDGRLYAGNDHAQVISFNNFSLHLQYTKPEWFIVFYL